MIININPVCCGSPSFFDIVNCDYFLGKKRGGMSEKNELNSENEGGSSSHLFVTEETTINSSSEDSSIVVPVPLQKNQFLHSDSKKLDKKKSSMTEIEMMKKRFAKLLLGEDMSGSGNGVSTALSLSNSITNLSATLFGQIWRLEPLSAQKKLIWRREIEWLLSVTDHIVEFTPSLQTFPDGTELEVMTSKPRSDLYVNLPALRKLDNMLLDILDSFKDTEFWYIDQGIIAPEEDGSSSFRKPRQEEKWWLPVPRVSTAGLTENARKQLKHRRDCTNQILKAAMAINSITLTDMEIPESYLETLPKNPRSSLGDLIYRYITSDEFSPECLIDCLDLSSSEHQALQIANRVEASIYFWRRKASRNINGDSSNSYSKSSWEMVKDLVIDDTEKGELLAERAESLLLCLKKQFPCLFQTTLDISKIQYNTDIGKSILESYSRVLESLAFNIVARIDDLLHVDDLTRQYSDRSVSIITVADDSSVVFATPSSISPLKCTRPASLKVEQSVSPPEFDRAEKLRHRGLGVRKVLTDFLNIDPISKEESPNSPVRISDSS